MMTQALCAGDGFLPLGLTVQNVYTELHSGSKNVTVVVRNKTADPQTLRKRTAVARAVVTIQLLEPTMWAAPTDVPNGAQSLLTPKLTVQQRKKKLFEELDLSGLEYWPPKLADSAQSLLAEYHDIFCLEPS